MQNTRLNNLVNATTGQLRALFLNPWRRLSLLVISLLFGFFLGSAISTIAGQSANWDVVAAAIVVASTELVSWLYYNRTWPARRSFWVEALNTFKVGIIYSLFIEAFKLGS